MRYRASVTIEAAIVVPIVFYSLLLLLSLIGYLHTDYRVSRAAAEAATDFAYDSYLLYHLEISELLAHHSYQHHSLKPEDLQKLKRKSGELLQKPIRFDRLASGELIGDFREIAEMSGELMKKIKKLPEELPQIAKSEATAFVGRLFFDRYLKEKISSKLAGLSGFQEKCLNIKGAVYFYDFKASGFYVSYIYSFPLRLPFLKEAEILQPIYIESYIGNIRRYDGEKYQKELEKDAEETGLVYITEKGARYHTDRKCISIYSPVSRLRKDEMQGMRECRTCRKQGLIFGEFVYKTEASKVYHAGKECSQIGHQVLEISLEEAEKKGLTHCRHCQKKRKNE